MAFGTAPLLAQAIVGDVANSLTAAGSTQGTALKLASVINVVTTAAASTGVQLPSTGTGDQIVVANLGANALLVYPVTGGAIQTGAANAGFSIAVGKTAVFTARDASGNMIAVLSA
ncbi:hypothetical protein J2W35_004951 [Variovorax boronicumulans]|uniref:hypothetical protein n=1 Tax=Variovorax boronicumulans TaxID=436515 RepID=UPI002783628E|nr:hypothetical protein [Variovorax boronicumulans]MDQ0084582.1 hypothetical protein [Variovorax boronicumulans]